MPRLLVVDDVEAILFAMRAYFRRGGFVVDTTGDRVSAKRMVVESAYDVAITDLRLGGADDVDGLELAHFIRHTSPATKVVVLTAYGSPELETRAARLGVERFLAKPQPLAELAALVHTLAATVRA